MTIKIKKTKNYEDIICWFLSYVFQFYWNEMRYDGNVEFHKDFGGVSSGQFPRIILAFTWTDRRKIPGSPGHQARSEPETSTTRVRHHYSNLLDSNLKHWVKKTSLPPPLHAKHGQLVRSSMLTRLPSLNETVKTALAGPMLCTGQQRLNCLKRVQKIQTH
jgi:hypothetical protein